MFHPSRGGVRGGKDQFDWKDVKADKDRENYLGNSLMAPTGRWLMGRDIQWYTKDGKNKSKEEQTIQEKRQAELAAIKEKEAELLAIALGYSAKKSDKLENKLTKEEITAAVQRGTVEHAEADRILGVGFGTTSSALLRAKLASQNTTSVLPGQEPAAAPNTSTSTDASASAERSTSTEPITAAIFQEKESKKAKKEHKHKKEKKEKHHHDSAQKEFSKRRHDDDDSNDGHSRRARHDSPPPRRESDRGRGDRHTRDSSPKRRHDSPDHSRRR